MEFSAKKYIDVIDNALDLDKESKRKAPWIIIRGLNIVITIEIAIFLAYKFGFEIDENAFSINGVILGFKNYDVIVGVVFTATAYFGTRLIAWLAPYLVAYSRHWTVWSSNDEYKRKLNEYLENPDQLEKWMKHYEYRSQRSVRYSTPLKLILLFCSN